MPGSEVRGPASTTHSANRRGIVDTGDGNPGTDSSQASSFELLRRVVLGTIQSVSEGAELVGASVREELELFRVEAERRIVVVLLVSAGVAGISVGVMLLFQQLIGSWPLTLLLLGGAHVAVGVWLSARWRRARNAK